ncbi:nef attachable domain protein [Chlamydia psittaci 08DC60]|nr:nef attachable domain protein [Chlamydia psittaci 08DC60]
MEAHRGQWCKRKYPRDIWKPIEGYGEKGNILRLKTEKKLSEKLLCVLLIYFTELQLSPQDAFC